MEASLMVFVASRYNVSAGGIFWKMTFWIEDLPDLDSSQYER